MTSHNQGGGAPVIPPIHRIATPNGVRTPVIGGNAGPLVLDPNTVPRPPMRPEDVPLRVQEPAAAPVPAVTLVSSPAPQQPPQFVAAPQAPAETPWWLTPGVPFTTVQNHPVQHQVLWSLGRIHLGELRQEDGTPITREAIVAYYQNVDAAALQVAVHEFDQTMLRLQPAPAAPAPTDPLAAFASSPNAAHVDLMVRSGNTDAQVNAFFGEIGVAYARMLRDAIAAQSTPAPAPATQPSTPIPVASTTKPAEAAPAKTERRMTAALKKEAEAAFAAGKSVDEVAQQTGLGRERVERAHREWSASREATGTGSVTLTAAEALPEESPLMQAAAAQHKAHVQGQLAELRERVEAVAAAAPTLPAEVQPPTPSTLSPSALAEREVPPTPCDPAPVDARIGAMMRQLYHIGRLTGVSFHQLIDVLEALDAMPAQDRSELLGLMRSLRAMEDAT